MCSELDEITGRAALSYERRKKLIDFIEETLDDGHPVMVGVDYTRDPHAINLDRVTDHWLGA